MALLEVAEKVKSKGKTADEIREPFRPTQDSCYLCGRTGCKLRYQGPAVGMMCEFCASAFMHYS